MKRALRVAALEDSKDNNSLSPLLYEGRKEKSMIKAEKHGDIVSLEVRGESYALVDEYDAVLRSLYQFLKDSVKDPEMVAPETLMYAMVKKTVREERKNARKRKTDQRTF